MKAIAKLAMSALSFGVIATMLGGCGGGGHDATTQGAAAVSQGPASQDSKGALCRNTENILFSCTTVTGKIVSVCGSKDLSAQNGYIQYRYGSSSKTELSLPADSDIQNFRNTVAYTDGSDCTRSNCSSDVTFTNYASDGTYAYMIDESSGRGGDWEGVYVMRNGQPLAGGNIQCRTASWTELQVDEIKKAFPPGQGQETTN
jgi:hypothetical protein